MDLGIYWVNTTRWLLGEDPGASERTGLEPR
jgi:hypothetical protein